MWSMRRSTILAAALAVAVHGAPAAGATTSTPANEVNLEKAAALLAQAQSLYNTPSRWTEAATLLEKSASYRPAFDPEIHTSLMTAASIWVSAGHLARGYEMARKAGESAHARGAVQDAAHSFMSAAAVAAQLGHKPEAEELLARARLLAESPLISDRDRELILGRDVSQGFAHLRVR